MIGDILTLNIVDLSRSGPGVARPEAGKVVFVPFTAPGDIIRAKVTRVEKRYLEAELLEVLTASPERQRAPCPAFSQCGACEWQHIPYERQWKTKLSGLQHALQRVQVNAPHAWEEYPAEKVWEYRNRVQMRGFQKQIGFYAKASKNIVPIEKCWIARPEINAQIPSLLLEGENKTRPYKVEVEVLENGSVRSLWNMGHAAGGFRQIHDEQNEKLRAWVQKHIRKNATVLDLFGGKGNLSQAIAKESTEIHCVDIGSYAQAPEGTASHYFYHQQDSLTWLQEQVRAGRRFTGPVSAILDPPRDGLGESFLAFIEALKALEVTQILAIGCDADSWARDMARLTRHGYFLQKVGALDLFPQTHHIEALAVLEKH